MRFFGGYMSLGLSSFEMPIGSSNRIIRDDVRLDEVADLLGNYDEIIAAKDWQLEKLVSRVKQRDAALAEMERRIAEMGERIAENSYHLNRINASPWWRIGVELDKLILSPLRKMGHASINAINQQYLDSVISLPLDYEISSIAPTPSVAVLLHAYYVDQLAEIQQALKNIPFPFDVFVSTDSERKKRLIEQCFACWSAGKVEVQIFPNRGRDIAPKFVGFRDVHERYEFVLHIHAKSSPYGDVLVRWGSFLLDCLLGSREGVLGVFEMFRQCSDLGVIAPRNFAAIRNAMAWGVNFDKCSALAERMGVILNPDAPIDFAAGSMFWARSAALRPLLDLDLTFDSFEEEKGQTDGALGHAIERLTFYSCELAGYGWVHAGPEIHLAPFEKAHRISSRLELDKVLRATKTGLLPVLHGRRPQKEAKESV
jgi:lipopolysaccharide biosynthesis protein